jgi:phosphoenolpyruvate-protein phosphotransferase
VSRRLTGIPGAPGIAFGPLAILDLRHESSVVEDLPPEAALERFAEARVAVQAHLHQLGAELHSEGKESEAAILDAQAMLAADPALDGEVRRLIGEGRSLDSAIDAATAQMAAMLGALDDPYLRERAADVRAVGQEIRSRLSGAAASLDVPAGSIVVAHDLTPAQTAVLRKRKIAGFATAGGTATGHVAILARALEIPAVVGLGDAILDLPDGQPAILAADDGVLIVQPTSRERARYESRRESLQADAQRLTALRDQPAVTIDGQRVQLWANIGHPDEAEIALKYGAEGIGLFRTEFLFLDRDSPPAEDEQCAAYSAALRAMSPHPVIVRTLDIGGDKPIPYLPTLHEANPFLGVRGLRFGMRFVDLFRAQLRALLRAAHEGDLRIMLPMVATVEDVAWARRELESAAESLKAEGLSHRAEVPLGIMIETPAAAVALDLFAPHIAFCSIGSNDLAQYTLAADRTDADLSRRYRHDDPAVLRLIEVAARTANAAGIEISLCGELGADPDLAIVLAGLGVRKISMSPTAIPRVKEAIRAVSLDEARERAAQRTHPAAET